mmetsp:Transcript_20486/g.19463  ORF Transcript_20486/g.19463 Transcript_20486/m.19463 type:complete len:294 (-) Transcript_20486:576-1457(-)
MDEPEEGAVLARELRGSELNGDCDLIARLHWPIDDLGEGSHLIPIGLDEESVGRPLMLPIVPEGPALKERFSCLDLLPVPEAFLHEPSLVDLFLLCRFFLSAGLLHLIIVQAAEVGGCVGSLPDLQHGVGVVLGGLTLLTEVKVIADTALVADPYQWEGIAAIASDPIMSFFCLFCGFLLEVVRDHPLEGLGGEGFYLILQHSGKVLQDCTVDLASTIAAATGETLLVDLAPITGVADDVLALLFLWLDDLAVDLLLLPLHDHLVPLAFGLDAPITADLLHVLLDLRTDLIGV